MKNITRVENTNNKVLRSIGNISGSISTYFLVREINAEDRHYVKRAKVYAKLFRIFEFPQKKWGTHYLYKPQSVTAEQEWTRAKHYKDSIK